MKRSGKILLAVVIIALISGLTWWMMSRPPESISLQPEHLDMLVNLDGEEDEYYEELKVYADGRRIKAEKVTWSSENEEVAIVESDGWVTSMDVGETTITAEYKGKTAKCTVRVKQKITSDTLGE